ncbi:hypothetical protein HZH66_007130 [Vespula vulgaris]|uniref:Uncharacterized protein n=1 Tax=Vespula vulgaris TaxID=7454 RepID=A0A834JXC4_VESVU|nr:hypothetical protein HZH66_007130 [Vespula vulgaris]
MSLGATIAGRQSDYSPSRKPIVLSIEGGEPIPFDGTPERRSDESQDDRHDRHAFAKSRASSPDTCTSANETDERTQNCVIKDYKLILVNLNTTKSIEADYETSSEGPSRLVEGKSSHTRFLSKSYFDNLRKEEEVKSLKVLETKEKPNSKRYAYLREDVDDITMSSVSLPILRNIESNPITEVKDRMISDSSFARQQKLQMIVEQTELLLSAESKLVDSIKPEVSYLGKKYELNRRESLMLLPVIQKRSIPRTTIKKLDKSIDPCSTNKVSHDLIDIIENPELSRTSFYIPPYPVNDTSLLDKPSDDYSFDSSMKRQVTNDTNVLLKIHGELSPLRCELSEIAAKFRALRLQRMYGSIEENKNAAGGYVLSSMDIDRGLQQEHRFVGNLQTQFSPMTMVGKSMSRESFNHISTGNSQFFVETGLHGDRTCVSREPSNRQPSMYFEITSGKNESSIGGTEYLGERIANYYSQTNNTPFEHYYRPRSSCIHDRYQRERGSIVRSVDEGYSYYRNFISRKSCDINGSRYVSRGNADQPADLLILGGGRSKEVVREDHHIPCDRRRGKRNLLGSSMGFDIVTPKVIVENSLSAAKESSTNVSLCKGNRYSSLEIGNPYPEKKRSICSTVKDVEMLVNEETSKDLLTPRESRLNLKHRHQKEQVDTTTIVNRSSQTSKQTIDFKEITNTSSSTSTRRIKAISVPKDIEKVKIVPVFFTTGIPKPLFPLIELDDDTTGCSINERERSLQRRLTLKEKNSRKISNNSTSGRRGPSESDVSDSYVTGPLTLHRDYFSENERWHSGNASSKMSVSCFSRRSCSSKKTTSSNALKYTSALGSICSGVARVTVSGTAMSNQQKRFTQIREITHEKGIRGMRSSPEDFLSDT